MRELVEAGLRRELKERRSRARVRLRDAAVLQGGLQDADWERSATLLTRGVARDRRHQHPRLCPPPGCALARGSPGFGRGTGPCSLGHPLALRSRVPGDRHASAYLVAALDQVEAWRESPTLALLHETESYPVELRGLMEAGRVDGPRVHDARIAALCRAHGVNELWTADRDLSRFAGLSIRNPLFA